MNDENDWDHNVKGDGVEGPVVCVCRDDVVQVLNDMKTWKSPSTFKCTIGVDCCYHGSMNSSDG